MANSDSATSKTTTKGQEAKNKSSNEVKEGVIFTQQMSRTWITAWVVWAKSGKQSGKQSTGGLELWNTEENGDKRERWRYGMLVKIPGGHHRRFLDSRPFKYITTGLEWVDPHSSNIHAAQSQWALTVMWLRGKRSTSKHTKHATGRKGEVHLEPERCRWKINVLCASW